MSGGATLRASDLHLQFPDQPRPLFRIPSLDVAAGSALGISGPSGAGKTSLFHCLSGIARPTRGRVRWNDTDITRLADDALTRWRHRHLGLVFQDFHLIDGLPALDNVLLPCHFTNWRPTPALRNRARQLLDAVGIGTPKREVARLSRGERQRVALARALLFAPETLLADEPTASLDPAHRQAVTNLLVSLAREHGTTLIVVSHDAELLSRMDRHLCLRDGRLHPPEEGPTPP